MQQITKTERAFIVNKALDDVGVQLWGRAGIIKKAMNCSPATASGWLGGTLPKDAHQLIKFSETYNLCINLWVEGVEKEKSGSDVSVRAKSMIVRLRQFESDTGRVLTPEQFADLYLLLLSNEEKAIFLLEHHNILLSSGAEAKE